MFHFALAHIQIFEVLKVLEVEGMLLHTRHFEVIGLSSNGINQYVIRHLKDILVVHLRPKKRIRNVLAPGTLYVYS